MAKQRFAGRAVPTLLALHGRQSPQQRGSGESIPATAFVRGGAASSVAGSRNLVIAPSGDEGHADRAEQQSEIQVDSCSAVGLSLRPREGDGAPECLPPPGGRHWRAPSANCAPTTMMNAFGASELIVLSPGSNIRVTGRIFVSVKTQWPPSNLRMLRTAELEKMREPRRL